MKVVLSIAGSDSSGGAGIQADIKSAEYHGAFMTTAITAITAQNSLGVQGVIALEPYFVKQQIESVLSDFDVDSIKIGMLSSIELIKVVDEIISSLDIPIVLDPVAISKAGSKLIADNAIETLKGLFPKTYLITPNSYEAKEFFKVNCVADILNCNNYGTNILFKDIEKNNDFTVDILKSSTGKIKYFQNPKANSNNTHGTGCSYSSSIASLLAQNYNLIDAIKVSKDYISKAIINAPDLGKGNGPINHSLKK